MFGRMFATVLCLAKNVNARSVCLLPYFYSLLLLIVLFLLLNILTPYCSVYPGCASLTVTRLSGQGDWVFGCKTNIELTPMSGMVLHGLRSM